MSVPPAYLELEDRFRRMALIDEAATVLHWDAATGMPSGAGAARADQLAELRVLAHREMTDPAMSDLLDGAERGYAALDVWQAANLREMRQSHRQASALNDTLVSRLSQATSACEMVWREARANSDFGAVLPALTVVLEVTGDVAAAYSAAFGLDPYDALMETYAPGLRVAQVQPLFDSYEAFLPDFLDAVLARQQEKDRPVVPGPVPVEIQRRLVERLAKATGFDFGHGRIDVSAHPFSTGYPGDQRITVAYDPDNPMFAIMAALHECGHAAYERGLPKKWARQPVGSSFGMVVHESQSLSVEMQAARSSGYLSWLSEEVRAIYGEHPAFETENFRRLQQWVEPSLIRVDADEVTYPAHIILRTRLEQAMLDGDLLPADLPDAWNTGMRDLLGVDVPDDARGCMQDIHWFDGAFGYFPTYTLGAMLAAQLAEAAHTDHPEIAQSLGRGEFSALMDWLGGAIHSQGRLLPVNELIIEATGKPLDGEAFERHLRTRYLSET